MAVVNSDTTAVQLEKVRSLVPKLFEQDDTFLKRVPDRSQELDVSSRAFRLPLLTKSGGKGKQTNLDGGAMGRGGGVAYEVATSTPVSLLFGVEITDAAATFTNGAEKAVENVLAKAVTYGMAQFRMFMDALCNTAGDGVVGSIASGAGTTSWTMAAGFAHRLLYVGQTVTTATDNTFGTLHGTAVVTGIDPETGIVTVDTDPGTSTNDVVAIEGMGTAAMGGGNMTSSILGIPYHHSNSATGSWMGLARNVRPYVRCPGVNAGSVALTTAMVRQAKNKIRAALGVNSVGQLFAYCGPAQAAAYEELGISISEIQKENPSGGTRSMDLLFQEDQMKMDGTPLLVGIHTNASRIDFVDAKHWGKAVAFPVDFHTVGGQNKFPVVDTSSTTAGGLVHSQIFYFQWIGQLWLDSPRNDAYIYALAVPSGYVA